MNGPKQASSSLANFSEEKKLILEDIRAEWGKFSDSDLDGLSSNDDLVNQIVAKYSIDRTQAEREVDAVMRGRQI